MNNEFIKIKFQFPIQAMNTKFKAPNEIIMSKTEKIESIKAHIANVIIISN